jgi:lysophospholipase L1-like esterase
MKTNYPIRHAILALLLTLAVAGPANAARAKRPAAEHWVASWAAAQQLSEPKNQIDPADLRDATLRQSVHLSLGGRQLRLKLSNAFGTAPLRIDSIHLALAEAPGSPRIVPASDRAVTFGGRTEVVIPAGGDYLSDPVDLAAPALANVTISLHLDLAPEFETGHPGSRTTTYYLHGNHAADPDLSGAGQVDHWYFIAGIETLGTRAAHSIVAFGDSITDGRGSTTNGNDRWTDVLAAKLQGRPATRAAGVLNLGIGGNHLLLDGLGPNAVARFNRDVLAQSGVNSVILLEGINDIGTFAAGQDHAVLVRDVIEAYRQMVLRARAHRIRIIGATITPFGGSATYPLTAANEADRQAINAWVRRPGNFDKLIDFDAALRDPHDPQRLNPLYDSGDHLHPSAAGYRVMGEAAAAALRR